jgi:hypothetical protein
VSSWAAVAEILLRTLACSNPCIECAGLYERSNLSSMVLYHSLLIMLCTFPAFLVCDLRGDNLNGDLYVTCWVMQGTCCRVSFTTRLSKCFVLEWSWCLN